MKSILSAIAGSFLLATAAQATSITVSTLDATAYNVGFGASTNIGEDFEALGSISHTKKEKATDQDAIGETVEILSDFIDDEAVDPSTSAKAYVMLALYFQHHFQFSESMGMLSKALATLHRKGKGGNDPEVSRIREYADNISLVPIALVPKSSKSVNIIRFARIPELFATRSND